MARILIVDDEPDMQRIFAFALRQFGHDVDTHSNGAEALTAYELAKADGRPYDVLMLDIGLPFINGFEIAEKIRGKDKSTPFVFVSGLAEDICENRITDLAPATRLCKPLLDTTELETEVKRVLGRKP